MREYEMSKEEMASHLGCFTKQYVEDCIENLKESYMKSLTDESDAFDKAMINCSVGTLNILKFKLGLD